jgi:3-phenylpropionate/trans-cinnamate dioxygenase ferredoxin subunit
MMADWEAIASTEELSDGERKSVVVDETPALLLRVGDAYYCVEDVCTHDGQPLTEGPVAEGQITCPRHGARFELATGAPKCMPATEAIRTFRVEVRSDGIFAAPEE